MSTLTPAPVDLMPFSDLHTTCTPVIYMHTNAFTHINRNKTSFVYDATKDALNRNPIIMLIHTYITNNI